MGCRMNDHKICILSQVLRYPVSSGYTKCPPRGGKYGIDEILSCHITSTPHLT